MGAFDLLPPLLHPNFCSRAGLTLKLTMRKMLSSPLRTSSVKVNKSAENGGFVHIYCRNPSWETSFFVQH